jgi:glutathione peroxidase
MLRKFTATLLLGSAFALSSGACLRNSHALEPAVAAQGPIIDHEVVAIDGSTVSLASYRGSVLLIVNTASNCGFTSQLGELQELHERYADRGLMVLGFPCNDFGGQEPGTNEEIAAFCDGEYGVTFPLFDKVSIRGDAPSPLYATLQNETPEGVSGAVRWNFTKFLVDTEGRVVARFDSAVSPTSDGVVAAIESLLPR